MVNDSLPFNCSDCFARVWCKGPAVSYVRFTQQQWPLLMLGPGREHGPKPKVNYRALIDQQTAAHEQLEVVHARYQQLLSQCLGQCSPLGGGHLMHHPVQNNYHMNG